MPDVVNESKEKAEKKKKKRKKEKGIRLFPANKKGFHVMHVLNFFRFLLYPWNRFFYPFKLHGNTKVGKGACIYVGNHYCMWDIFYPARTTKEGVHFIAKRSVTEAPVLKFWMKRTGVIDAARDGSDVRTLTDSLKCLKSGEKVAIFPEGTRNKVSDEEFLPFHGGFAFMAIKTKSPIIPFVICNRPKVFHKTHVVFGEPVELTEYYDRKLSKEDYDEADQKIVEIMYALREEFRMRMETKKKGKKKCRS